MTNVISSDEVWNIARTLSAATDIPAEKIAGTYALDGGTLAENLRALFTTAQYGHVFGSEEALAGPAMLSAYTDRDAAHPYANGSVRIRFDLAPEGKTLRSVRVFRDGSDALLADASDTTFLRVPVRDVFPGSAENIVLRLVATFTDGTSAVRLTNPFSVEWDGNGEFGSAVERLSTRSEGSDRDREDLILSVLQENFVLCGDGWRRTVASPYHVGDDRNAADFNRGSGNEDLGRPVVAPAAGTVVRNDTDGAGNSVLVLRHVSSGVVWFSKYLHMQNIAVNVGDVVQAGDALGEVGKVSNDASMSAHLHFEVYGEDGALIDLRNLLTALSVPTTAWDGAGPEVAVRWDPDAGHWMAAAPEHAGLAFIVDPEDLTDGRNNVWVAWHEDPAQRERVVFVHDDQRKLRGWFRVDSQGQIVVEIVDGTQYYSQWIVEDGVGRWTSLLVP